MKTQLLFVDDEEDLLTFFQNVFVNDFDVTLATAARDALSILETNNEFAVIVTDLNMPEMDGIELLRRVKELAPDAVTMMLTGFATKDSAIAAVNKGDVFRFLTKPIKAVDLRAAVNEAIRRYEVDRAERLLLEQTVRGSVSMLMEVLAMAHPVIFGRAAARRQLVASLCELLQVDDSWAVESAALLCDVGMLSVPQDVTGKILDGQQLSEEETAILYKQATVGAELVRRVPRLEAVADAIALQYKNYDGSGYPEEDQNAGQLIPVGARVLRLVNEYQKLRGMGVDREEVLSTLRSQSTHFDLSILSALEKLKTQHQSGGTVVNVSVNALRRGSTLAYDVRNLDNALIVRAGQEVSDYLIERLRNFVSAGVILDSVTVRVDDA